MHHQRTDRPSNMYSGISLTKKILHKNYASTSFSNKVKPIFSIVLLVTIRQSELTRSFATKKVSRLLKIYFFSLGNRVNKTFCVNNLNFPFFYFKILVNPIFHFLQLDLIVVFLTRMTTSIKAKH